MLCCAVQASAVVGEYQLMFREALADGQAREKQCGVLQARAAAAEAEVSYSSVTSERLHNSHHNAVAYCHYIACTLLHKSLERNAHLRHSMRCCCRVQHANSSAALLQPTCVKLSIETACSVTVVCT
jgi:hypothetical protein